ncbi:MAG: hypothetical protein ACI4XW_03690, partial [Candidatus Spyradocola sp.]
MLKKTLCALLCALLMLTAAACSAAPAAEPSATPADTAPAEATPLPDESADEELFYTKDDPEYRELYSDNAIDAALDDDFTNAVTLEDFDARMGKGYELDT